jgi:hypothetical protein
MRAEPEVKTPDEWMTLLYPRNVIKDDDGWRRDGKSFDEPITREEFELRLAESTATLPGIVH